MTLHVPVVAPSPLGRRRTATAAAAAVACAAIAFRDGGWTAAALAVWAFSVVIAAIEDAVTTRLRDCVIGPGMAALGTVLVAQAVVVGAGSLIGPVVAGALFGGWFLVFHLVAPAGLGYGDVKFAALLGLGIGVAAPAGIVPAMILAVVVQIGVYLARPLPAQRSGLIGRREAPFGPALAAASFVVVLLVLVGGR